MTTLLLQLHYGRAANGIGPLTEFMLVFYTGIFFSTMAPELRYVTAFFVCGIISFSMTRRYSKALLLPPISLTTHQLLPSCLVFGFSLLSFWGMVFITAVTSNWAALALAVVGVIAGSMTGLLLPRVPPKPQPNQDHTPQPRCVGIWQFVEFDLRRRLLRPMNRIGVPVIVFGLLSVTAAVSPIVLSQSISLPATLSFGLSLWLLVNFTYVGADDRPGKYLWLAHGWRMWWVLAGMVCAALGFSVLASLIDATWGYVVGMGCSLLLVLVFRAKVPLSPDHQAPCHPLVRDIPRTGMVEFIMMLMVITAGVAPVLVFSHY